MSSNPLSMTGIAFTEFSTDRPEALHKIFLELGFSLVAKHKSKKIDLYKQNEIIFHLNHEPGSFGSRFQIQHGPSVSAMGWRFENASSAHADALKQGARAYDNGDYSAVEGRRIPAVYGIGESLIYFVEAETDLGFVPLQDPVVVPEKGFMLIDHLTNNVFKGTMADWANFYKSVFGFQDVRHFDIKGQKTGLTSYALRSPCGTFCIPINEADEAKSQINEYLDEYKGPGIQHIAFLTRNLPESVRALEGTSIQTLDIDPGYYSKAFARVSKIKEDRREIEDLNILLDGDQSGYLLQIFTKTMIGPIFFEFIQRENHLSFGEGNFQALFDSIERDQIKRGVL